MENVFHVVHASIARDYHMYEVGQTVHTTAGMLPREAWRKYNNPFVNSSIWTNTKVGR